MTSCTLKSNRSLVGGWPTFSPSARTSTTDLGTNDGGSQESDQYGTNCNGK